MFARPYKGGLDDAARVVGVALGVLSIGAAVVHLSAAGDHRNLPVMMAGFLCVATAQAAFGALCLWRRPGRVLLSAGLALMAGSLVMWLLSRTVGLPFLEGGHMEPIGFKDGVTKLFELGAIGIGALLFSSELARVQLPTARIGTQAMALLGTGMFALSVPALVLGGGEHHSAAQHAAMHAHGADSDHAADGHSHDGTQLADASGHGHAAGAGHTAAGRRGHAHAGVTGASAGSGHAHGDGSGVLHAGSGTGHAGAGHDDAHNGGSQRDGSHGHGRADHGGGSHDGGGGHGHDGGAAAGHEGHEEPPPEGIAFEPAADGKGSAIMWRGKSSGSEGPGHHAHGGPCNPTADQRARADALVRETAAALRRYDNNPARALADGFYYAFGPTDRTMHMVSPDRLNEPEILNAAKIESFLYALTDRGWIAIGGMYIMPKYGMAGPEIGGCLTKWHYHGGVGGRIASAGTMESTPQMLHVWTYPGLDPWGHYNGRDFSQLFTPAAAAPSFCREFGDASDVCLP